VQHLGLCAFDQATFEGDGIPPAILGLTGLTSLELSSSSICTMDADISRLSGLKYLAVWNSELTTLPPTFSRLSALSVLDFGPANLFSGTDDEAMANWRCISTLALKELTLRNCGIRKVLAVSLPAGITYLDLSGNPLGPEGSVADIQHMRRLKELNLSSCNLSAVPPPVVRNSSITSLDLSENLIVDLTISDDDPHPEHIGWMRNLRKLCLQNNRLPAIPPALNFLKGLETLDLSNNKYLEVAASLDWLGLLLDRLQVLKLEKSITGQYHATTLKWFEELRQLYERRHGRPNVVRW